VATTVVKGMTMVVVVAWAEATEAETGQVAKVAVPK